MMNTANTDSACHPKSSLELRVRPSRLVLTRQHLAWLCGFQWGVFTAFSLATSSAEIMLFLGVMAAFAGMCCIVRVGMLRFSFFETMLFLHATAAFASYALSPQAVLTAVGRFAALFLVAKVAVAAIESKSNILSDLRSGIIHAGIAFAIYQLFFLRSLDSTSTSDRLAAFSHANHVGYVSAFTALSTFEIVTNRKNSPPTRLLYSLITAVCMVVLFYTKSRTALGVFGFGLLSFCFLSKRRLEIFTLLAVACCIVPFFLTPSLTEKLSRQLNLENRDVRTFTGRIDLWKASLEIWSKHVFFGVGPGVQVAFIESYGLGHHGAHNGLLFNLVDLGLLGTLPLVMIILKAMKSLLSVFSRESYRFYVVIFLAGMIESVTEPFLFSVGTPAGILVVLSAAVLCARPNLDGSSPPPRSNVSAIMAK